MGPRKELPQLGGTGLVLDSHLRATLACANKIEGVTLGPPGTLRV